MIAFPIPNRTQPPSQFLPEGPWWLSRMRRRDYDKEKAPLLGDPGLQEVADPDALANQEAAEVRFFFNLCVLIAVWIGANGVCPVVSKPA